MIKFLTWLHRPTTYALTGWPGLENSSHHLRWTDVGRWSQPYLPFHEFSQVSRRARVPLLSAHFARAEPLLVVHDGARPLTVGDDGPTGVHF
jgi:hypothetical protein